MLCVIDISSKYAWVVPLKDQKGVTITNAFQKILDELVASKTIDHNRFYNRFLQYYKITLTIDHINLGYKIMM